MKNKYHNRAIRLVEGNAKGEPVTFSDYLDYEFGNDKAPKSKLSSISADQSDDWTDADEKALDDEMNAQYIHERDRNRNYPIMYVTD